MTSNDFEQSNEFDDLDNLDNEELRGYLEDIQEFKRERERLDNVRRQNERLLRIKQISSRLKQAAEFAQWIVDAPKFKKQFCLLYNNSITKTTLDISEIVVNILSSKELPPAIAALVIIALKKTRNFLEKYCSKLK